MSFFTATTGIPATNNDPSVDQPNMQVNNDSMINIWPVDHHGFNDNQGGYHNIIHLPPQVSDPAAIPGIGQLYTKSVLGDPQLYYETGNGTISKLTNPSGLTAAVALNFSVGPGPGFAITINNSYNVASVVRSSQGSYLITFTNAFLTSLYYPFISAQAPTGIAGVSNTLSSPAYIPTTTTIRLGFQNSNSSSGFDPVYASLIIFA